MHLSDAALGAVLDPGGGTAGTAALAHAARCAECSQAIQEARTADRDVAELLSALDHPAPVLHFSTIAERAAGPDIGPRRTPQFMKGLIGVGNSRNQWAAALSAYAGRNPAVQWVAILLAMTAMVAVAAVPRSPVRHLIATWISQHDRSGATVPVGGAAARAAPPTATTPRGVAIIARGPVVVTIRLPQADGAIRLTTAAMADARGPRVSVLASGDGATYLVSQDTIAIDNRAAPRLDYDVTLPPALQLPVVTIRVAGRVIFARHGAAIVTTGVKQPGGGYAIPLSIAGAAAF